MTYTLNTTSLGDVQVEEMQMNTNLQTIPIPLQTSDNTIGVGYQGLLRVFLLQGVYAEASPTPQAWVKIIADLVTDDQRKSTATVGYTYHSDQYSASGKDFNVYVQRFKYRFIAGEAINYVAYEINMVEVSING